MTSIDSRDITPLIARLMYCARAVTYMELMIGNTEGEIGDDLRGLHVFVKDMAQTPFGHLMEVMHRATTVASNSNVLPSISWFGDTEYKALAIHGKKIELNQLRKLCSSLYSRCKSFFERDIKMGLPGIKNQRWDRYSSADDLSKITPGYYFGITEASHGMDLMDQFMFNAASRDYFSSGTSVNGVLWRRTKVLGWLKRCKTFLQMMMPLCHLLGGQPGRATEISTIRWCNSIEEQRGVYWLNDTIMLLSIYSKNRSRMSKNRVIPRYISASEVPM